MLHVLSLVSPGEVDFPISPYGRETRRPFISTFLDFPVFVHSWLTRLQQGLLGILLLFYPAPKTAHRATRRLFSLWRQNLRRLGPLCFPYALTMGFPMSDFSSLRGRAMFWPAPAFSTSCAPQSPSSPCQTPLLRHFSFPCFLPTSTPKPRAEGSSPSAPAKKVRYRLCGT